VRRSDRMCSSLNAAAVDQTRKFLNSKYGAPPVGSQYFTTSSQYGSGRRPCPLNGSTRTDHGPVHCSPGDRSMGRTRCRGEKQWRKAMAKRASRQSRAKKTPLHLAHPTTFTIDVTGNALYRSILIPNWSTQRPRFAKANPVCPRFGQAHHCW